MAFSDLVTEVLNHGFDANIYRTRVKTWINEGQRMILRELDIPGNEYEGSFATVSGTSSYSTAIISPRFQRMNSVYLIVGTSRIPLEAVEHETILLEPVASGQPAIYSLRPYYNASGDSASTASVYMTLYPTPNAVRTVGFTYIYNAPDMSADADVLTIPDDYAHVVITYALSRAWRSEDDFEASAWYTAEYQRELALLKNELQYPDKGRNRQVPGMWRQNTSPSFVRPQ